MTVETYMTKDPVTAGPDSTAEDIARLLVTHRIGCVPVVDADGKLLGLITEREMFLQERRVPFSTVIAHSLMGSWVDPETLEQSYQQLRGIRGAEIMSKDFAVVSPSTPTGEAARLMVKLGRNHLPVVEEGRLAGILARHDLLRALLRRYDVPQPQGPEDGGERG